VSAEGAEGAANERTALAWQRTALALLAGAALLSRLTLDALGAAALVGLAVAVPLAGWVLVESRLRYLQQTGERRRPRPRGGRFPTALTVATLALAATELTALLRTGA
jgi:uncharacterized membrane protein YidH (DUF202 family)